MKKEDSEMWQLIVIVTCAVPFMAYCINVLSEWKKLDI